MIINHNMNAMNAQRMMSGNTAAAGKSMEKLSSGLRINKAGDDAAGLAISEKMRGQIRGLDQAGRNAQDGISMIQTAEGALNETHSIIQRMRELANQSANGTNTDGDRSSIQDEMNQLTSEVNRIGNTTEFNTQKLLNGGIGANNSGNMTKATGASIVSTTAFADITTATAGGTIKVDNLSFNLDSILTSVAGTTGGIVDSLKNLQSGSVKLSDLVDISKDSSNNISISAKSSGSNSNITINSVAGTALKLAGMSVGGTVKGTDTTIDKVGIEGTIKLSTASATINKNDSIKITVGSDSAVEVILNSDSSKTYDTTNADANVAKSQMNNLVKDLNASLQKAGMSDKVEVSLSQNNTLQFISNEGKNISIQNGTGTSMTAALTFSGVSSSYSGTTIKQIVGPGAQGAGFGTTFQIGANNGQSMSLNVNDMRSAALGITGNAGQLGFTATSGVTNGTTDVKAEAALDVMTKENASKSLAALDKAIATVSSERGKLGAMQNRLEHTIANLGTSSENLTSAESRIRDVDMAKEMMNFSKNNILTQASQAMLAQAKSQPEAVLQLLR